MIDESKRPIRRPLDRLFGAFLTVIGVMIVFKAIGYVFQTRAELGALPQIGAFWLMGIGLVFAGRRFNPK